MFSLGGANSNSNTNNLEHCLRQKLTSMENSIARIYSIKSQLRNSAEQTRKDVSNAIDHQLQCVRAREQELLVNLENIISKKEQKLCEQQEKLNQAIGACQQSLECVLSRSNAVDTASVQSMLLRTNAIDLRPKETSTILFEFDPSDLRRDISSFGRIIAEDQTKTLESLPLDVEHYEDDANLLSHKSVLRLHPNPNTLLNASPEMGGGTLAKEPLQAQPPVSFSESINFWLSQMRAPTTAMDCGEDGFEYIRDRITSMSNSSYEVLNSPFNNTPPPPGVTTQLKPEDIFSHHFMEINRLPSNHWLKERNTPCGPFKNDFGAGDRRLGNSHRHRCAANARSPVVLPDLSKLVKDIRLESTPTTPTMAQSPKPNAVPSSRKRTLEHHASGFFDFEKVIRSIQLSDDEQWLLGNATSSCSTSCLPTLMDKEEMSTAALQNSYSTGDVVEDPRCGGDGKGDTKSEQGFQHSAKKNCFWQPPKITAPTRTTQERRPANENAEELDTWESVLGWKRILEKIHASGEDEWLAPSSRKLAAESMNV